MKYLFNDNMYFSYEAPPAEDKTKYEYRWFASSIDIQNPGWREDFERLAQGKLAKLNDENKDWEPNAVIRDTMFASGSEPETMKPLKFGFRRRKS